MIAQSRVDRGHVLFQNGIFRIRYVRLSDQGEYKCEARNSAGGAGVRTVLYVSEGQLALTWRVDGM